MEEETIQLPRVGPPSGIVPTFADHLAGGPVLLVVMFLLGIIAFEVFVRWFKGWFALNWHDSSSDQAMDARRMLRRFEQQEALAVARAERRNADAGGWAAIFPDFTNVD